MRTDARKDGNHKDIIKTFEALGWVTHDLSQLKKCCDAVICKNLLTVMIEIKDGSKVPSARKLSQGEKDFRDKWRGSGFWALVESLEDVEKINDYFNCLKVVTV